MRISPYQNGIIDYDFKPFQTNIELETKVLLYKQNQFDTAYAGLQKLKKQALNIQFLNKEQQGKIDSFNKNVTKSFASLDTGNFDLSKVDVVNKYSNMFNTIARDTQLVGNYRHDRRVQGVLSDVRKLKNSKDPFKAGYHPLNEANFQNRLNNYVNSTEGDLTDMSNKTSYTRYIDTDAEMAVKLKHVPIRTFEVAIPQPDGTIKYVKRTGKDPNQVRKATREYFKNRGATQVAEEAEYYYNQNKDQVGFKDQVTDQYYNMLQRNISDIQTRMDLHNDRLSKATSPDEKLALGETIAALQETRSNLIDKQAEVMNITDDNVASWITSMYMLETENNYTEAFGGYAESTRYEIHPGEKLKMQVAQLNSIDRHRREQLELGYAKLGLDFLEAGYNTDGSAVTSGTSTSSTSGSAAGVVKPNSRYAGVTKEYFSTVPELNEHLKKELSRDLEDRVWLDTNPLIAGIEGSFRTSAEEEKKLETSLRSQLKEVLRTPVGSTGNRDGKFNSYVNSDGSFDIEKLKIDFKRDKQYAIDAAAKGRGWAQVQLDGELKELEAAITKYENPTSSITSENLLEKVADRGEYKKMMSNEFLAKSPYLHSMKEQLDNFVESRDLRSFKEVDENTEMVIGEGDSATRVKGRKAILNELSKQATEDVENNEYSQWNHLHVLNKRRLQGYEYLINKNPEGVTSELADVIAENENFAKAYFPMHFKLQKQDGETKLDKAERERYGNELIVPVLANVQSKATDNLNINNINSSMLEEVFEYPNGLMKVKLDISQLPGYEKGTKDGERKGVTSWTMHVLDPTKNDGSLKQVTINETNPTFQIKNKNKMHRADMYYLIKPTPGEWETFNQFAHKTGRYYRVLPKETGGFRFKVYDKERAYLNEHAYEVSNGNITGQRAVPQKDGSIKYEPFRSNIGRDITITELLQRLDNCYVLQNCADAGIFNF